MPIANWRCCGSWNMFRISDRVDGARVAPAMPSSARIDQQKLAPADAVAERAHRDQEAGDEKAVDVDDPEQFRAGWLERGADRRQREVQDREVHRVDRA